MFATAYHFNPGKLGDWSFYHSCNFIYEHNSVIACADLSSVNFHTQT